MKYWTGNFFNRFSVGLAVLNWLLLLFAFFIRGSFDLEHIHFYDAYDIPLWVMGVLNIPALFFNLLAIIILGLTVFPLEIDWWQLLIGIFSITLQWMLIGHLVYKFRFKQKDQVGQIL